MKTFTVALGSDHAGFTYKELIKAMLLAEGHTVRDFGTYSEASCDYPDFIRPVAEAVARGDFSAQEVAQAALARLRWQTVRGTGRSEPLPRNGTLVAGNAMAACLPFFEAIALRQPATIRLGLAPDLLLEVEFDFPGDRDV